ncbi:cell envelope integrity protein CreD [Cellvibrio sp. UBA7661]|uniref:cell envelope integrity protein CreD n=1 Tax=Cellvibrio sp. UBA7661 TaxID=1946311 RepID=UPI002F360D92
MKKPLLFKLLTIGLLMLLLLIPLAMIGSSIDERKAYSEQVVQDIAKSSSYSQTITGPILVIPYIKTERIAYLNDKKERVFEEKEIKGKLYFLPELLRVDTDMNTELRKRGIYRAHLYHTHNLLDGHFSVPEQFGLGDALANYQLQPAYIALGISDIRGIENALDLQWNQKTLTAEPGSHLSALGNGVHINVGDIEAAKKYSFSLPLQLQGTGHFNVIPLGKETHLALNSDWPHPSFIGDYLPVERSISSSGFSARWQTSFFSTNMSEVFARCVNKRECDSFNQTQMGVNLIDPINQYVKSDRAIKYALLFIALTFAGFFLFEILKRLQVHPIQYALVGLSLAFFYLLLISLSEHIGFATAYGVSAAACVSLIGFYVSYVLHSIARAFGFTLGLALLYALLYGLLSAEDYALLMGSVLLFTMLGAFMALTRNVDWYNLNGASK